MHDNEFRELVDRVKSHHRIENVIAQHIQLDRNHKALCPFHTETEPSLSVNITEQYFLCFGCGVGGDVIKFLELYEKKSFMEVLTELANEAGIVISTYSEKDKAEFTRKRKIWEILSATAEFYHRNLTPDAKEYLVSQRRLSEETIKRYKIGYAAGGLLHHLVDERKFDTELCIQAGVLKRISDNQVRDYFYKRIIFPNYYHGQVVHFTSRSLGEQNPKYLHLPGTIPRLYNEEALQNQDVIVAEGVLDCLTAIQAGLTSVGIYGVNDICENDIPKFSMCDNVYLCLDGDEAGRKATLRIADLLGKRARIVELPTGKDLNDYFQDHTADEFKELLSTSQDAITHEIFQIPHNCCKTDLPQRLKPVLQKIAKLDDPSAEAYLNDTIKKSFKLKNEDVKSYRKELTALRKKQLAVPVLMTQNSSEKSNYIADFEGLVDIVSHERKPAFLIKDGAELIIKPQVELNGKIYIPPVADQIPWLLPRGEEILDYYKSGVNHSDTDRQLYQDLTDYHKNISDLPGEEYYDLIVAWDFHTYMLEAFQYSPIICLFAVPERGKSRTGKGMIYVAHKGMHVESLREAYIIRMADYYKVAIFFDVMNVWQKATSEKSEDILLQRFEKGVTVARVNRPDLGAFRDIDLYTIFGATIIGTNESMHRILDSRSVQINMPETLKSFENNVMPENSLALKERLVAFRARHLNQILPTAMKPAKGRLGDILRPLQQIIRLINPERDPVFLNLIAVLQKDRLLDKSESLEADILKAIADSKGKLNKSYLSYKAITEEFNQDKPEKQKISERKVGSRLAAMGFQKGRTSTGSTAMYWDEEKIKRNMAAYGLDLPSESSVSPESPEARSLNEILAGVPEDSEHSEEVLPPF